MMCVRSRYFIILVNLFLTLQLVAQTTEVDSLKGLLETPLADTMRIDVLNTLAEKTRRTDQDVSQGFSAQALDLANDLNDVARRALALKWQGAIADDRGQYLDAMEFYQKSLENFSEINDTVGQSNLLNSLGVIYNSQGNDVKALESFLASLRLAESLSNSRRIAVALLNVGSVYMKKEQTHEQAIENFEMSLPYFDEAGYELGTGVACINLGETFMKMNELDSALNYLQISREIFTSVPGFLAQTLYLIGEAETRLGNYSEAIETQREAIEVGKKASIKLQTANALKGLGSTYLASGNNRLAISSLREAETLFVEMNSKNGLEAVYKGLAEAHRNLNDFVNAYNYQVQYSSIKDTIYNVATSDELKNLRFSYDLEKKESEIALLNKENDLQQAQIQKAEVLRNFFIAMVLALLVIAAGVVVQWRIQKKSKERKQALDQEKQLTSQLKAIDKMKDQFLANTSHELKTPLNGIIGLADSLIDGVAGDLPKKAISNLDMIAGSGRRLANLVNDILDFSKLKSHDLQLQLKALDMHTIAQVVVTLSEPLKQNKEVALINDIPYDIDLVDADENRVQQIMHNLVGNAIKFTEEGSIRLTAKKDEKFLAISISDTGIGIPKDKFDSIFQSFEQGDGSTAREFGGTGLGLSVSQSLVDLHGGKLTVESEVGEGSIFTFTLPLSNVDRSEIDVDDRKTQSQYLPTVDLKTLTEEDQSKESVKQAIDMSAASVMNANGDKVHVLVVDDEPVNRQVLENHLSIAGYDVTQAADGSEALDLLSNGTKYDLILLDIMMPKMSGYEVCDAVRRTYLQSELPIVMLTAKNQVSDLVEGFNVGANDYLTKPFAKDELLSRIKTHVSLNNINKATGKFVPSEFLRVLGRNAITEIELGDHHEQEVTVFFSDIRSYTSLAETMGPANNFRFVNAYNKRMGPIIQEHGGFVNQYLGDGIMAIFTEHTGGSVQAAVDMQLAIQKYNVKRINDGRLPIKVGMGMHTGMLIMGIIGDGERLEPATISDAVNTAARVEGLTKHFGANILLTENTYLVSKDIPGFHFRKMGKVLVKGKKTPIRIYECFDGDKPELKDLKIQTFDVFEDGVNMFFDKNFKKAKGAFEYILSENPMDLPAKKFLKKVIHNLDQGVPKDWTGIEEMLGK